MLNGCNMLNGAEFYIAIDNKGLWPNLTLMANGEIAAAIYNHPSHGYGSGSNIELWTSSDEGKLWDFRSTVSSQAENNPRSIRMNHAVGLNSEGHIIAMVSGYQENQRLPFLPLQLCISPDNGLTWSRSLLDEIGYIPFGDIIALPDRELLCAMYIKNKPDGRTALLFSSKDGGVTWSEKSRIGEAGETNLLYCKNGVLLAAGRTPCRESMDRVLPHGAGTMIYRSNNQGQTWDSGKLISPQGQENAHLLELLDGRILCAITSRIPGLFGVIFRISADGGGTWSVPEVLISIPAADWRKTDSGYPSSVQLPDGTIVTAFYYGPKKPELARYAAPWHQRYHMGVARWKPDLLG